jgi:hypothetical protein
MGNEVSSDDFLLAEDRWFEFWGRQKYVLVNGDIHPDKSFARFLGFQNGIKIKHSTHCTLLMRPSAVRKIKLLAGPYYHALLVTYRTRRNEREKNRHG